MQGSKKIYWLDDDPKVVVNTLDSWHRNWFSNTNPITQAWYRNSLAYYSTVLEAQHWETALGYSGEQGELVRCVVPMARNLTRQMVSLITKQNLNFSTVAQLTGTDVRDVTRIGTALASQQVKDEDCNLKFPYALELAMIHGGAFIKNTWRTDKGAPWEQATPIDGAQAPTGGGQAGVPGARPGVVYKGETEISVLSVFDVCFDYNFEDWNIPWCEARTKKNRWDLIAQHPDLTEEILKLPAISKYDNTGVSMYATTVESDLVYVYELYVAPSPSMPNGRMMFYSNDRTIYTDYNNLYGCIPIEQLKPESIMGVGFGYPFLSNLLPLQEMLDHSFSVIASNQAAFGVQNILNPRNNNISVQEIGGMNFISYTPQNLPGGGEPKALQLCATAPEIFKFLDICRDNLTEMSNLNAALRGQPLPGVTSGVAYATLTANALEFLTSGAKAYADCAKKVIMHGINNYRRFGGKSERYLRVVNDVNGSQSTLKFVGSDLDPIQYVELELENPLMQSIAGRLDIAEKMIGNGIVKSTDEYISILDGQPLKKLINVERAEEDLIQSENEALQRGEQVMALSTDDHAKHVMHHNVTLKDPKIRASGQATQNVLTHILEHRRLAGETDPMLMAMVQTGKMPDMAAMGAGGPPGGAMPPSPGGSPIGPADAGMPQGDSVASKSGEIPSGPTVKVASPSKDLLGRNG